jgi:hypothetical protein
MYKKLTFQILVFDEKNLKRQTVTEVKILYRLTYTHIFIFFTFYLINFRLSSLENRDLLLDP